MNLTHETETAGYRAILFGLVLRTAFMTVLTLGLYSFWARTRLRRWLWSSVRPAGSPVEYTGNPWEKLAGLFVAAVILAVYVGLVVMGLAYLSLVLTGDVIAGLVGALLMVFPLFYAAKYRSWRYLAGHTRWRGIDFAVSPGALGYAWRGCLYSVLAILSFGLLAPLKRFQLEKYRIDRTYYGSEPFFMTGTFVDLYKAIMPLYVVFAVNIGLGVWAIIAQDFAAEVIAGLVVIVGLVPAWVYWRVASFRILANNIVYGNGTEIEVFPKASKIFWTHVFGSILVSLLVGTLIPLIIIAFFAVVAFAVGEVGLNFMGGGIGQFVTEVGIVFLGIFAVVAYLTGVLLYREARHVFITFPVLRHTADSLTIEENMPFSEVGPANKRFMGDADGLAGFFDFGGGV